MAQQYEGTNKNDLMLDFIKGRSVVVHLGFKAQDNNSDSKKKKPGFTHT